MKKYLIPFIFGSLSVCLCGTELKTPLARILFDDKTGSIQSWETLHESSRPVTAQKTIYHLLAKSGDLFSDEQKDSARRVQGASGEIIYQCSNPDLPGFRIQKKYWIEGNGLRRELTFVNESGEKRYIMPFTETHFSKDFMKDGYYFGAGYLGPLRPAEKVRRPLRVEMYKQSSKGMVLTHNSGKGSFAHYRVKINDTVVYPWWQSTIGRYRETADRLYYLRDGWRMCLGTLDVEPNGGKIRLTDAFHFFYGDIHSFFRDVYGKDQEVRKALAEIPESPCPWTDDVFAVCSYSDESHLRYLNQMVRNGTIIVASGLFFQWADYRIGKTKRSYYGGEYTYEELQDFCRSFRKVTPRARHFNYNITVSATFDSPIVKEHPEWFRRYDRNGREDSLFPGVITNYQTMMNNPDCRNFMANHLFDSAKEFGLDMVYLDEAQQQNTINWQTGELIRDDHNIALWQLMKQRSVQEKIPLFFNGSGLPFADINYMEALEQLKSENWRDFAGVALGLELFSQYRPQSRISLIGWYNSKKITDYANRCVALGWLPQALYPAPLLTMRAAYEVGKTLPIPAQYTPDWKKDFQVDVESYAVKRRDSDDVVLSFINRSAAKTEIPVDVDLSTLGFTGSEKINVWAMPTRHCSKDTPDYVLSEDEEAVNYRNCNWRNTHLSAPRLIYSGYALGKLQHTFSKLQLDDMGQMVVTRSPVSIYAIDGVPGNYFFTSSRDIRILPGNRIRAAKECVLLFADKSLEFTEIRINNKAGSLQQIDVGGLLCQTVVLPPGEYELSWETQPRKTEFPQKKINAVFRKNPARVEISGESPDSLYTVQLRGRSCWTGKSPLLLPERYENGTYTVRYAGNSSGPSTKIALSGGKGSAVRYIPNERRPELLNTEKVDVNKNGLRITAKAEGATYGTPIRRLQENLQPCSVTADEKNLRLQAVTTRKESGEDSNQYAGFEIAGAKRLHLKMTNDFFGKYSPSGMAHHVYGAGIPQLDFAGFVVDYRVNGKYTWRVDFSVGLFSARLQNPYPRWGCGRVQNRHINLGDLINQKKEHEFVLDISKYAPAGWDGTMFFSVGCNHVLPLRGLTVELRGTDEEKVSVLSGHDAANLKVRERKIPAPLALGKLETAPNPQDFSKNNLDQWAKIPYLLPLPSTGDSLQGETQGYCAYDEENIYFVIFAHDQNRQPVTNAENPWENDCVEFYFHVPQQKGITQIIADAGGKTAKIFQKMPVETDGIVCTARQDGTQGYRLFLTIPWKHLGIQEIYPGIEIPFNLCRTRRGAKKESSSWAPVRTLFNETEVFGKLQIGRFNPVNGRFSEYQISTEQTRKEGKK